MANLEVGKTYCQKALNNWFRVEKIEPQYDIALVTEVTHFDYGRKSTLGPATAKLSICKELLEKGFLVEMSLEEFLKTRGYKLEQTGGKL